MKQTTDNNPPHKIELRVALYWILVFAWKVIKFVLLLLWIQIKFGVLIAVGMLSSEGNSSSAYSLIKSLGESIRNSFGSVKNSFIEMINVFKHGQDDEKGDGFYAVTDESAYGYVPERVEEEDELECEGE